jgi:hypothetical protein
VVRSFCDTLNPEELEYSDALGPALFATIAPKECILRVCRSNVIQICGKRPATRLFAGVLKRVADAELDLLGSAVDALAQPRFEAGGVARRKHTPPQWRGNQAVYNQPTGAQVKRFQCIVADY